MALEEYRADAMRCTRCAYCKWIPFDLMKSYRFSKGCPSIEAGKYHSYSAGGRLVTALSLMDGRSTVTERVKDSVFKCTLCGQCDVSCKICRYDMEPLEAMRELRATLVSQGHTLPQVEPVIEGLRTQFNMVGQAAKKRGDWASELKIKDLAQETAEYVFFPGCRFSFDGDLAHVTRACVKILQQAGVDFGIFGKNEKCCGGRAYDMGYRENFNDMAKANLKAWKKAGVKTVITPCAECYHTFSRKYTAKAGSEFKVVHIVQLLAQLLREGKLKLTNPVKMAVTYHDPCHLGRQGEPYVAWNGKEKKIFGQAVCYDPPRPRYNGALGVYEEPREILRAIPGIELREMERIKEASWCCGAGGGSREAYPEFSRATANERLEEAQSTGAGAIVTACGWCERNFIDSIEAGGAKLKVYDIIELAAKAL
jgi:Fe-S oxidoreductase